MIATRALAAVRPVSRGNTWWRLVARGAFLLLTACLTIVVADDVYTHRALPRESAYAHRYMHGMVRVDPEMMWQAYSPRARHARGDDQTTFAAYLRLGTHLTAGTPNAYRLVASLPFDDGQALLYYQVGLSGGSGTHHLLVPVVVDREGRVEDAANDGVHFVPPTVPHGEP